MAKKPAGKGIVRMSDGRFEARVKYRGKSSNSELHSMYVGMYDTLDSAKVARNKFVVELF
mgnify:CR=1 FL=1